jgi:hypothetical protein
MITGKRSQFEARCRQRGYTLDEVRACIVSEDGDTITVDETHRDYPREPKPGFVQPQPPTTGGPGTELKALLKSWLGIVATPNCSCNAHARQMDEWGPDVCEQNLPTIVGWLEGQAKARKLPFVRFLGEQAVKLAIRRARRKARK